ncbi:MAG: 4Fe-4S binding protein [Bacteroidales bacterium]|jgi:NAD-dependent dihydropyrimidine dehydrogenase PreA subunit|nr:4Fe-4S binding protein [Bacteroidales bacterium]HNX84900.1 4Fe-4S binding protein [Bacteroidales bacterium]HOC49228.1 4Fe-4S binding protein [Bacteroidales bacterium]HPS98412.1 4Fe-4S binding protein [Bacteroidales bacterium]
MKKQNWYKLIYQFAIIAILAFMGFRLLFDKAYAPDFEAYCPFGGLQALGSYMTMDSLSCSMTSTQIMMGVALFIGIVLFSRLFCGYICPLGTIGEWTGKLGDRLKVRITLKGIADKALRLLKYVLLFITFYFTLKSSELFCKKFDPYYAVASGFDTDVVLLWALIAIGALLVGSLFFRLFWCRYLCPLGALSAIFKYSWWFLGVMAVYVILLLLGLNISYVYPLLIVTAGGYILEVTRMDRVRPDPVHITRNTGTCTSCGLCTESCPQGIDVASMEKVTHADCTLCGDCLHACPEKDTLQINKRNMKWLPAVVLGALIILGITAGSLFELPTISQQWGTEEQLANAGTFEMSGLKNIKCFGSSTAFANQMRSVEGIYGVSTYVASHTVHILYDTAMYNDEKIQQLIFVPVKRVIEEPSADVSNIVYHTLTIDKFFDPLDATYLQHLLDQKTEAVGYQSDFACPVIVRIYFPEGKAPDRETLIKAIESKNLRFTVNETEFNVKLPYRVVTLEENSGSMPVNEFAREMFMPVKSFFNEYQKYTPDVLKGMPVRLGDNAQLKQRYNYLISHISNDEGVVGFETLLNDAGEEMVTLWYVDTLTVPARIFSVMNADSLLLHYGDGTTGTVPNPFRFAPADTLPH